MSVDGVQWLNRSDCHLFGSETPRGVDRNGEKTPLRRDGIEKKPSPESDRHGGASGRRRSVDHRGAFRLNHSADLAGVDGAAETDSAEGDEGPSTSSSERVPRAGSRVDRITAALVAVIVFALIAGTLADYGFVIDEATYVWVAEEARRWFREAPAVGPAESFSAQGIARRWHFLEPPAARGATAHSNFNLPVAIHLMNLGWLAFGWYCDELTAYRLAIAALFAVTAAATYCTVASERNRTTGLFAAVALVATPRIFGHAHLAATETPLSCLWLCALLALSRLSRSRTDRDRTVRAFVVALFVGLTMSVKLTGWLMVVPIGIWIAVFRPLGWRRTIVLSAVLTPLLIVTLTPPLWHDPVRGLVRYLRSAGENPWKITSYYLGVGYRDGLPWTSGFVLVGLTTPVALLVLSLVGVASGLRDRFTMLFTSNAAMVLACRCLGLMPQHDGERQFLPYFYFAAVLAALGVDALGRFAFRLLRIDRCPPSWRRAASLAAGVVALGLLAEPLLDVWVYRKHALSYYNRAVGGLRGAADMGLEISYWFESATDDVWRRIAAEVPKGSRVFLRPDHPGLDYLRRRGLWRADVESVGPDEADFFLLSAKRAAYVVEDPRTGRLVATDLLVRQQTSPAVLQVHFDGVRLLGLFRRPRPRIRGGAPAVGR